MIPIRSTATSTSLILALSTSLTWADHPTIGLQGAAAGPITTTTAHTLPQGQWVIALDTQHINFDAVPAARLARLSEADEDVHSTDKLTRTALNLAYGVSDTLTLGVSLPYVSRENLTETAHEGGDEPFEALGDADGLGDLQLFAAVNAWQSDNGNQRIAVLGGIKAPTGKTSARSDEGERLEVEIQPGSGSWDPFLGLAYSHQQGRWGFDTNVLYTKVNSGSQSTDLGDVFNYNAAVSYSLSGATDDGHDHAHARTSLVLEVNGEWRDRIDIGDETENNSGGNVVYLAPGVVTQLGQWSAGLSVGVPVVNNLYGEQSDPELRLIGRIGYSF